ncbi:MAG TPA: GatB/YqeY domain-containing protein [Dissulfurispiraceae bacterium]|nr:GatB/YqeY domain-containing protein [Dissulfurispiraceae bacterium]
METIPQRLDAELKEALKSRNELKLSVLRMLKASLKNKEIEKMGPLSDEEIISVLSSMAKQRRDSIKQFAAAGRSDLAEKETKELEIVRSYLPAQLSPEELDRIIYSAISECNASSPGDMGKVMKIVAPLTKGTADGKAVNQRVKELLGAS